MKIWKLILASAAMVFAVNVASAQTLDVDSESVALVNSTSVDASLTAPAAEQLKVWPEVSSVNIVVDLENTQEVQIFSCTGRLVKTEKVEKGQDINIETLMPGPYTVKAGNKVGQFTKE